MRIWTPIVAAALLLCVSPVRAPAAPKAPSSERPVVRDRSGEIVSRLHQDGAVSALTVPLAEEDGLLLTDALRINDQAAGWVVIDTGAGFSAVDREAARALGLTTKQGLPAPPHDKSSPEFCPIASLSFGAMTIENHAIVVADLSSLRRPQRREIAGIIGGDLLGALPFTIDYRKPQLVLHTRESFRPPRGEPARRMLLDGPSDSQNIFERANPHAGAPVLRVAINDEQVDAMLDTGFAGSVVLLPKLVAAHPEWIDRGEGPVARAAGAGGPLGMAGRDMMRARIDNLRAMGVSFTEISTALALDGEFPADRYDAVIGNRVLSHLRLTFDYASRHVWAEFDPPAKNPPRR